MQPMAATPLSRATVLFTTRFGHHGGTTRPPDRPALRTEGYTERRPKRQRQWPRLRDVASMATGVVFCGSLVRARDITDGTSITYLAGEKYVPPDIQTSVPIWPGANWETPFPRTTETARTCAAGPRNGLPCRTRQAILRVAFWKCLASGFNMAFCDGSVQSISY